MHHGSKDLSGSRQTHKGAVLFLQNVIHRDSIAAQLAAGRADFLLDRYPVTIEPAVQGLQYVRQAQTDGTVRYVVTGSAKDGR